MDTQENALKHGLIDGRGWLRVEVRRQCAKLRYTVSDNGVGFSEQLTPAPLVIFTTAYSEYAVKAFELQALDYLPPAIRERL